MGETPAITPVMEIPAFVLPAAEVPSPAVVLPKVEVPVVVIAAADPEVPAVLSTANAEAAAAEHSAGTVISSETAEPAWPKS